MPETPTTTFPEHGAIIPEVSILYPIDYWRLLTWIFINPKTIVRYRTQYGADSLHEIGSWLATAFIWLPLLFPIIGYFTEQVPLSSTVATIFVVALPMSAWFVYTRKDLLGAALGAVFFVIHVIDKTAADGDVKVSFIASVALSITFIVPTIISLAVTNSLAMSPFIVLCLGVGSWVSLHVGGEGFIKGFLIGAMISLPMIPFITKLTYLIQRYYQNGKRSLFTYLGLLITILSYATLIWIYILDGWESLLT